MPYEHGSCPACQKPAIQERRANTCPSCGTVFFPYRRDFTYGDSYPIQRDHTETQIRHLKRKTIEKWLSSAEVETAGSSVLEIGFGGGAVLEYFRDQGCQIYGQEIIRANCLSAIERGIPASRVVTNIDELIEQNVAFDLLVYCDSFEHLLEPEDHLQQVSRLSRKGTQALLVLPRADCISRVIMKRWWPHDLPDHWIFYSQAGLIELWSKHGWRVKRTFFPGKMISLNMVFRHIALKAPIRVRMPKALDMSFPFNFGELGIVFELSGE